MIELPRSTFYYRAVANTTRLADDQVAELIQTIQDEMPGYGYRRVTHELRRRGHVVNHKRVARLMRALGLGIKPRRQFVRTTDSNHDSPIFPNLYRKVIPSQPDLVWVADARHDLNELLRLLDVRLAQQPRILGDSYSLVDLLVANVTGYSAYAGAPVAAHRHVQTWLEKVQARPSMWLET